MQVSMWRQDGVAAECGTAKGRTEKCVLWRGRSMVLGHKLSGTMGPRIETRRSAHSCHRGASHRAQVAECTTSYDCMHFENDCQL
jgi:hypothetical protein